MGNYKVLQTSFINDSIAEEGDIVILDDSIEVGNNLELIPEIPLAKGKLRPLDLKAHEGEN